MRPVFDLFLSSIVKKTRQISDRLCTDLVKLSAIKIKVAEKDTSFGKGKSCFRPSWSTNGCIDQEEKSFNKAGGSLIGNNTGGGSRGKLSCMFLCQCFYESSAWRTSYQIHNVKYCRPLRLRQPNHTKESTEGHKRGCIYCLILISYLKNMSYNYA